MIAPTASAQAEADGAPARPALAETHQDVLATSQRVVESGDAGRDYSPTSEATCDFSTVPGVVWWGSERRMTVERLVSYAAPVYWFSPDEPLLDRREGPDIMIPEGMPNQPVPDGPVVYYQIDELLERTDVGSDGPGYLSNSAGQPASIIDLHNVATLRLLFVAYFSDEVGLGAHPHDTEATEMKLWVARSSSLTMQEWAPGQQCSQLNYVIGIQRTSAKAHGLQWFWNVAETDEYTSFPMHLLVEEGKHGIATDINSDGVFTPGYDVNVRINDAWGVRDIIRTGMLFSGGFEPWMAKTRRPEHRVFPPLPEDSPLRAQVEYLMDGREHAEYALRPYPSAALAEGDHALEHIIENHEVPGWPIVRSISTLEEFQEWSDKDIAIKSLSISYRYDGAGGFSFVFPFFVVKHLNDTMSGGYILHRMYLRDEGLRDFGWMAMYMPSASRWLDTYFAAGAEYDVEPNIDGEDVGKWDFVLETGIKFRVNVTYSPLKFLSFLTPYWGLRLGVKNRGAFDINSLGYVIEFGAGSF
jgi:hypothetical protein